MGKNQKSISQRLKSKKTYQGQHKVLSEWCENWHKDQMLTINQIYDAVRERKYGDANMYITHLHVMTDKRFTALGNIINIVSNPDRKLEDQKDSALLTLGEGELDTP